jgi:hypothetical protein
MLHRVALVRTDVSEEHVASIVELRIIGDLGTRLAITSSETSVLTRASRRNIQEDGILHSQNVKTSNFT